MANIYLFGGPRTEELEAAKTILESTHDDGTGLTVHLRFGVAAGNKTDYDIANLPKLICRAKEIPGTVRLNLQHLSMTVETLEYRGNGPLMLDGVDVSVPGTILHVVYSLQDHSGEIDYAEEPTADA